MNAGQSAKVAMYRAVKSTVAANPSVLTASPAFATAYISFTSCLVKIEQALGLQAISSKGTTETKDDKRASLTTDLLKIGAALTILGTTSNNRTAQDVGSVTMSMLKAATEDAFIGKAKVILQTAQDYSPALEDLGITPEMLDGALTKLNAFVGMVGEPQQVISEKRRGTTLIKECLQDVDALLKDRMDPATMLMGPGQADFVMQYSFSRQTHKAAYRTRALQVSITDSVNGAPLAGVNARLTPVDIQKVSSTGGGFYVSNLEEGSYEVVLELPGYQPKNVTFTVVSGQRTVLDEQLVPVEQGQA